MLRCGPSGTGKAPDGAVVTGLQRCDGALQVQVSPQAHFGPQVQGWHEQFLLEHSFVMSFLL